MKVLFISHDATRTGAPIVFLHLLNWLKKNSSIEIHVLLKDGGELMNEFSQFDSITQWNYPKKKTTIFSKLVKKLVSEKTRQSQVTSKLKKQNFDLIYANSAASSSVVLALKKELNIPVWMHVHELSVSISQFCGRELFKRVVPLLDKVIGVSKAVCYNLELEYGIKVENQALVYEYVTTYQQPKEALGYMKNLLGIDENTFVVGGSGTTDWRKGPDLFIQTARDLFKSNPEAQVIFVWLGGKNEGVEYEKLAYDINRYRLEGKVLFLGSKPNPHDYFQDFDCFFISSREDPYPLVCLENAALGNPVLCFENSGGMPEFVETDAGVIVAYGNTSKMAEVILDLYSDENKKKMLGAAAKAKVQGRHDVAISGRQILDLLELNK